MFLGGIAQGYSQGLLANEESADRAELLKQRKLENSKREEEALQAQIEKANLSSAEYKDKLAELKQNQQRGAPLPIPGQQPQQMAPQPPAPGQASVPMQPPSMMNQGQVFQRPQMPPPMAQQQPPPMAQQQPPAPPMGMINQTQQRPMMTPNMQMQTGQAPQIPPYVDPNKMQQRPPMPQGQPTPPQAPPQSQAPQQPPAMQQSNQPIKIGDMVIETPMAKSTLMEDIKRFNENGYTPGEIKAVLNRDKLYYESIGNAEKEANTVAQQVFMDKMRIATDIARDKKTEQTQDNFERRQTEIERENKARDRRNEQRDDRLEKSGTLAYKLNENDKLLQDGKITPQEHDERRTTLVGGNQKMTMGEERAFTQGRQAILANSELKEIKGNGADFPILGNVHFDGNGIPSATGNFFGNRALTDDEQRMVNAARLFAESAGHMQAGARLTDQAFQRMVSEYIDQPGDSDDVKKQKQAHRDSLIQGSYKLAGRGGKDLKEYEKSLNLGDSTTKGGLAPSVAIPDGWSYKEH